MAQSPALRADAAATRTLIQSLVSFQPLIPELKILSMFHRPPAIKPNGRPTKLTPERRKLFLRCLAKGHPIKVAARAVGVSHETVKDWMRRHNDFEAEVRAADTKALEANLKFIHDARGEEWTAAAWLVERGWPELYARPEIQLNQINIAGSEVTIRLSPAELLAMQEERARAIKLLGRDPATLPLSNGEESYEQEAEES
jgi:Homeodomain-like domain